MALGAALFPIGILLSYVGLPKLLAGIIAFVGAGCLYILLCEFLNLYHTPQHGVWNKEKDEIAAKLAPRILIACALIAVFSILLLCVIGATM